MVRIAATHASWSMLEHEDHDASENVQGEGLRRKSFMHSAHVALQLL
jgi:hypothetical protein